MFPQPQQKKLNDYYTSSFNYSAGAANEQQIRKRARIILGKLHHLNPSGKSLLDIGSGYGFFLDEACKTSLKVSGIEPSLQLFEYSNNCKLQIEQVDFEKYMQEKNKHRIQKNKFDFVTMIHVLEHVKNPIEWIKNGLSLLKPNGILYIETPNYKSHLFHTEQKQYTFLTPPEHLWIFSAKSIKYITDINHAVIIKTETYSYPEHVMGILKSVCKQKKIQPNRLANNLGNSVSDKQSSKKPICSLSYLKYLLFDTIVARLLLPSVNICNKGSILELYIRKN